ncbi:hypothetical protein EPUS_04189 [Endocarpon pusillum Z07020]|uniref:Uncharacterized protein n=1 Tax=Endocarpon pusillum (strain Z07020 / HMAS-L-300199) TaxID=1263415 RepID=U1GW59_ENDPU|nr:uncharacterized protein EPUS_04189 [Endocarpon pusillum Z07020]ERF76331.1 hypothetical protein EPUS_04189 [Endocarpon pusillum Z07020]
MSRLRHLLTLLPICLTPVLADYLGPRYPPPADLTSDESLVAASWANLTSTLQAYLSGIDQSAASSNDALSAIQNVTFSLGMFSIHDSAATEILQFHHTSAEVANAPNGTNQVDGDTIYRIASVSKLFTVYAGLLGLDSTDWDRPLTEFFPQLMETSNNNNNIVGHVQWDLVTPRALAAQIAGVPRDFLSLGEFLLQPDLNPTALGLPLLDSNDPISSSLPCIGSEDPACAEDPERYIMGVQNRPPTFLPWTSPGYSNNGFSLLGLVLANITGKTIDEIYRDSIFDPLDMTNSNSSPPIQSEWFRAVIPGDISYFASDSDMAKSSGGLLSTTQDLAKLGVGILNHTLLPPDETRKWMKPLSHTARLQSSVGAPWEIVRYTYADSGVVTDLYTKGGDSGHYGSFFVLLPDFDAGFSILTASTSAERLTIIGAIGDLVADTILPALMAQAAAEAESNFAGSYTSTVEGLNSSLTLSLNQSQGAPPGLAISSFISNGTDVLLTLPGMRRNLPNRLLPSIADVATGQVAFRAVRGADAPSVQVGPISQFVTADWFSVDGLTYGGLSTELFVFDVDSSGRAVAVNPAAFRVRLERTDG